jgi:hypothetical protein
MQKVEAQQFLEQTFFKCGIHGSLFLLLANFAVAGKGNLSFTLQGKIVPSLNQFPPKLFLSLCNVRTLAKDFW